MYQVAQCWDDGVVNDIIVAEICRKYNAKATFNINPGLRDKTKRKCGWKFQDFEVYGLALDEMPSVYEGFQVASHTMTHPRPTQIPLEQFRMEATDARKYIEDVWQREARGFAWPCGDYNDDCIKVLREEGFAYGRTTKNAEIVIPCEEPLALPSHCHFLNPDFDRIREKAKETGTFYFWGHNYEMKDDPRLRERYEAIIREISADPEAVWVDVIDLVK